MKKAKIIYPKTQITQAKIYMQRMAPDTVMEVAVQTRAEIGERVAIPELNAERTVVRSRWVPSVKIVWITAYDYLLLSNQTVLPDLSVVLRARQILKSEDAPPPRSRAKTPGNPRAGTR